MVNSIQESVELAVIKRLSPEEINKIMNAFNDKLTALEKENQKLKDRLFELQA